MEHMVGVKGWAKVPSVFPFGCPSATVLRGLIRNNMDARGGNWVSFEIIEAKDLCICR